MKTTITQNEKMVKYRAIKNQKKSFKKKWNRIRRLGAK